MIALEVQNHKWQTPFWRCFPKPTGKTIVFVPPNVQKYSLKIYIVFIHVFVCVFCYYWFQFPFICVVCGYYFLVPFLFGWSWFVHRTKFPENSENATKKSRFPVIQPPWPLFLGWWVSELVTDLKGIIKWPPLAKMGLESPGNPVIRLTPFLWVKLSRCGIVPLWGTAWVAWARRFFQDGEMSCRIIPVVIHGEHSKSPLRIGFSFQMADIRGWKTWGWSDWEPILQAFCRNTHWSWIMIDFDLNDAASTKKRLQRNQDWKNMCIYI